MPKPSASAHPFNVLESLEESLLSEGNIEGLQIVFAAAWYTDDPWHYYHCRLINHMPSTVAEWLSTEKEHV